MTAEHYIPERPSALNVKQACARYQIGTPLRDVRLPSGSIVGAIVRGAEVITPRGDTVVRANDRVVILATAGMIKRVEKMFSVRLEFF